VVIQGDALNALTQAVQQAKKRNNEVVNEPNTQKLLNASNANNQVVQAVNNVLQGNQMGVNVEQVLEIKRDAENANDIIINQIQQQQQQPRQQQQQHPQPANTVEEFGNHLSLEGDNQLLLPGVSLQTASQQAASQQASSQQAASQQASSQQASSQQAASQQAAPQQAVSQHASSQQAAPQQLLVQNNIGENPLLGSNSLQGCNENNNQIRASPNMWSAQGCLPSDDVCGFNL